MKTKELSQEERILNYLQKGNRLTPIKALLKFDCMRLSGRIFDLRCKGWNIVMEMVEKNGKRFAEYRLYGAEKKNIWQRLKG
jgi:hypothetical protein